MDLVSDRPAGRPPELLDGARVLLWASSGDEPFARRPPAGGTDRDVFGLAVCRYDDGGIYLFSCNRDWEVVGDMDHADVAEAMTTLPADIDGNRVRWATV